MKKFIKLIVLVLGGTILLSCLAACDSRETAKTGGEKPELRGLMPYVREDPNNYPTAKMLEEKTGYKVKYYTLPQDNPGEKLNLIMASRESYDFIVTKSDLRINWADYAQKGALMELTDLVEKYGANIKSAMSESTFDLMRIDGKMYGIPNPSINMPSGPVFSYNNMLAVRQDWMEKFNIPYPKTVDEFTKTLRMLKENNPLGTGQAFAPLSIGTTIEIPGVIGAFGVPNHWNEVDGKLVHQMEDPRYLSYIKYLTSLYQEGLLDREFPTNKTATLNEKFSSGRAGMISFFYYDAGTVMDALHRNEPEAKTAFIDALTGSNGDVGIGVSSGALDRLVYIPVSAKHPEDAIKFMNMKLEDDLFKQLAIGEKGKHYTVENGDYYPIIPIFFDEYALANEFLTGINEEKYPQYWQARVRKDPRVYDAYKYMYLDEQRSKNAVQNPIMFAPVFESDANIKIINQLANDYFIKVIAGEENMDRSYNAFLSKWKSEGGEQMIKEVNEWYGAQKRQ